MPVFSCQFRGKSVCVTYDRSAGNQVVWIANVVLDGCARSIDGITAQRSTCVQADITDSVIRGLEWICKPRDS
jgi:hypothetical protein